MQTHASNRPAAPGMSRPSERPLLNWGAEDRADSTSKTKPALLVCVDGVASARRVLAHAEVVASALDAPLALAHVLETPKSSHPQDPLEWTLRRHRFRDRLDELARQRWQLPGAETAVLLEGPVVDQLSRWLTLSGARLLAFATREQGDGDGTRLGGTAARLLETAPASLLLVPPDAPEIAAYRRILVPLDGSCHAESVLPYALSIARAQKAEIVLAHVVPETEITEVGPLEREAEELRDKLLARNEKVARGYLEQVRNRIEASGLHARSVITRGDARNRLRQLIIGEAADLVILSAQGHGARSETPCGKVTAFLASHAAAPMLIVRAAAGGKAAHGTAQLAQ